MKRIPFYRLAATVTLFTCFSLAGTAFAQYVWVDEKGVKQFSDMPPPASIPTSRILKQPGAGTPPIPPVAPASTENASPSGKKETTTAEKNAEFRKRQLEQAEKEKKLAEETQQAADKAKNCERTREYNRTLESGERISRTDKNGERSYLTDKQRAQELRDARQMLEDCK